MKNKEGGGNIRQKERFWAMMQEEKGKRIGQEGPQTTAQCGASLSKAGQSTSYSALVLPASPIVIPLASLLTKFAPLEESPCRQEWLGSSTLLHILGFQLEAALGGSPWYTYEGQQLGCQSTLSPTADSPEDLSITSTVTVSPAHTPPCPLACSLTVTQAAKNPRAAELERGEQFNSDSSFKFWLLHGI